MMLFPTDSTRFADVISRRDLFTRSASGFAGIALGGMLCEEAARAEGSNGTNNGFHFAPRAAVVKDSQRCRP